MGLLGSGGYPHALKGVAESDIGVEVASILVEVQERAGAPRESAAPALPQLRQPSEFRQQRLKAIKVFLRRMSHRSSMTLSSSPTQGPAIWSATGGQRRSGCRKACESCACGAAAPRVVADSG